MKSGTTDDQQKKLSREDLYELVWSEPVSSVAQRFDISGRGLGKLCKRHEIPTPPRGYWPKKRNDQHVERTPLPEIEDESLEEIWLTRASGKADEQFPDEIETWLERESDEEWQIEVSDELTDEHELVQKTRKAFDLENLNRRGMAWPRDNGTLDVVVAPENIDRAVRIAQVSADALAGSRRNSPVNPDESCYLHLAALVPFRMPVNVTSCSFVEVTN